MKKILFLAIGLLAAGSVSAQGYYGPRRAPRRIVRRAPQQQQRYAYDDFYTPKVGLAIGANFANTVNSYNSDFNTGTIAGFNGGLTLDIPLIYPLSFEPEILYSQKGYTARTMDGNFTQRSHFIDVPLLAKFHLAPGFNFLVGPQISFLAATTNTYDNGFVITAQDHYDYNGNKTFLDGVIGVSVDLNRSVDLHARYTIDFARNDYNGYSYVPEYRNQVWQIGLGVRFQ